MKYLICLAAGLEASQTPNAVHVRNLMKDDDEVVLFSAFTPPDAILPTAADDGLVISVPEDIRAARLEAQRAAAKSVISRFEPLFPKAEVVVTEAPDICTAILAAAREYKVDVVALCARDQGSLSRTLLGSTSQDVLHHIGDAAPAVFIVHTQHVEPGPHSLVVCVDGSEPATRAARFAAQMVRPDAHDRLVLYMAVPPPSGQMPTTGDGSPNVHYEAELAAARARAQGVLDAAMADVVAAGVPKELVTTTLDVAANTQDAIVRFAANRDVHTLVLGSRGLGMLGRFFFGSVSTHVSTHAIDASVLVVH
eukprot:TRINITY_DN4259_c0_g2_i1.p1 TRINITY_DN4259_c0_g2~~TRINITY_DN4259_c0_g2_i1.p1  ORF type:complete len:309 (+),score=49.08 TRINITY_DN4259_c0_g2_i1:102-1028(+)